MALETLKGVKRIGRFGVAHITNNELLGTSERFIEINHDSNDILFTLQSGPVKESGANGCQVDTILQAGLMILEGLNKNYPCEFNIEAIAQLNVALDDLKELEDITPGDYTKAINHVKAALHQMELRTQEREARGVEGKNKA